MVCIIKKNITAIVLYKLSISKKLSCKTDKPDGLVEHYTDITYC